MALSPKDRQEIMMMIANAKMELRNELWDDSNKHSDQSNFTRQDVSDVTDAVLELGDIIGEVQEAML